MSGGDASATYQCCEEAGDNHDGAEQECGGRARDPRRVHLASDPVSEPRHQCRDESRYRGHEQCVCRPDRNEVDEEPTSFERGGGGDRDHGRDGDPDGRQCRCRTANPEHPDRPCDGEPLEQPIRVEVFRTFAMLLWNPFHVGLPSRRGRLRGLADARSGSGPGPLAKPTSASPTWRQRRAAASAQMTPAAIPALIGRHPIAAAARSPAAKASACAPQRHEARASLQRARAPSPEKPDRS